MEAWGTLKAIEGHQGSIWRKGVSRMLEHLAERVAHGMRRHWTQGLWVLLRKKKWSVHLLLRGCKELKEHWVLYRWESKPRKVSACLISRHHELQKGPQGESGLPVITLS